MTQLARITTPLRLLAAAMLVVALAAPSHPAPAPATDADTSSPLQLFGRQWDSESDDDSDDNDDSDEESGSGAPPVHLATLGAGTDATDGAGVGIALIDTGVSRALAASRQITIGPDLTTDGDGIDRYGHGTFLAGLLVGDRDGGVRGISPGARVISVKVAAADGVLEMDRVLHGIDWVIQNRDALGIRVLVLAMGHDSGTDYTDSPIGTALEAAWASGIVVVVPSGNLGEGRVTAPGDDPWLVSVGATDDRGTPTLADDVVAAWSGRGTPAGHARPDVVAPGTSLISVRAPGSTLDWTFGEARQRGSRFRGSGTSLATTLVGGLAANIIGDRPTAGPNDVKFALVTTARPIDGGMVPSLPDAIGAAPAPADWQDYPTALTSWDGSMGSWTGTSWTGTSWTGTSWTGTSWTGTSWTGTSWTGTSWTGTSWTGTSWTGQWSTAA